MTERERTVARIVGAVGIAVLLAGLVVGFLPFDDAATDTNCDGPVFSSWTEVVVPTDDGNQTVLGLCGPPARSRLAVAGVLVGLGAGASGATALLAGVPRRSRESST